MDFAVCFPMDFEPPFPMDFAVCFPMDFDEQFPMEIPAR
jgi:hypothetical protein